MNEVICVTFQSFENLFTFAEYSFIIILVTLLWESCGKGAVPLSLLLHDPVTRPVHSIVNTEGKHKIM